MLEWLEPQPGERVLDARTSAGLYARTLLKHTPELEVHALDFSLPFLQQAKSYAEGDRVAPVFVHADVHALPYRDAVFDAIVCGGSLNEFTDLPRTLSEFARVLKPGGRFFVLVLLRTQHRAGRRLQRLLSASGLRFFEAGALEEVALEADFTLVSAQVYPPVSVALYRRTKL